MTAERRLPVKVFDFEEVAKTRKASSLPLMLSCFFGHLFSCSPQQSPGLQLLFFLGQSQIFVLICLPTFPLPPRHHLYLNNLPALRTPCIKTGTPNSLPGLSLTSWRWEEKETWARAMRSRKFTACRDRETETQTAKNRTAPNISLWVFEMCSYTTSFHFLISTVKLEKVILTFPFWSWTIKGFQVKGKSLSLDVPMGRNLDPHFHEYCLNSSNGDADNAVVRPGTLQDHLA